MEFKQFEYFLKAARSGHITHAAQELFITQPALSRIIARLEDELGCELFERDGRMLALTPSGEIVCRYAEKLEMLLSDLRRELDDRDGSLSGEIRIGSSFPTREPSWIMAAVKSFALTNPDVSFHFLQGTPQSLESRLKKREIDLAVSSNISGEDISWTEMFTEPMGIILSRDHPLAQREKLWMRDLKNERFFCNDANSDSNNLTERFAALAGFTPIIQFEGDFPTYIGEAISMGHGVSVISETGFDNSRRNNNQPWQDDIVFRPLADEFCRRTSGIALLSGHYQSQTVKSFWRFLMESAVRDVMGSRTDF